MLTKAEMQPGDLVFLEAEYYDKSKKPQTHNMQHVEVCGILCKGACEKRRIFISRIL